MTLGYGHGDDFWRAFCLALRRVGYDGALSIEHEDMSLSPMEGIRKSVELLRRRNRRAGNLRTAENLKAGRYDEIAISGSHLARTFIVRSAIPDSRRSQGDDGGG